MLPLLTKAGTSGNGTDSLLRLLRTDKQDTVKVMRCSALVKAYTRLGLTDSAIYYGNAGLKLSEKLRFKKGIASINFRLGILFEQTGDYYKSLNCYAIALKFYEESNNKKSVINTYGNLGNVYIELADYPKSLEYYLMALRLSEEMNDKSKVAQAYASIGGVYINMRDEKNGLEFALKGLQLYRELGDSIGVALELNDLGIIYERVKAYKKALESNFRALKIAEDVADERTTQTILANIGVVYLSLKDYQQATAYFLRAMNMAKKLGAQREVAICLNNLGQLNSNQGKYIEAQKFLENSVDICKEIGALDFLKEAYGVLHEVYYATGRYRESYLTLSKYMQVKDSVYGLEKAKDLTRKQLNYAFEKREALTKAEHDKQIALAEAETRRQNLFSWFIAAVAASIAVVALVVFRSLKLARRQQQLIAAQKNQLEEHKKDIVDSITYAKRIQDAILPPLASIKQTLPESFVLYKPKDIVAGDFYWMESYEGIIFIAAADCTGHGVPGAMVSVVCSNALTRSVKEFGLRVPGEILDKARSLVLETFEKSKDEVKDGMDISLLAINKKNQSVSWSGANNPLWYLTKGRLLEIKADKQPIGKSDYSFPFSTHDIGWDPDSLFYLFTDGFADQFGGPAGKKFKYKQFSELLVSVQDLPPDKQSEAIDKEFLSWKGDLEQVDDICVIGLRIGTDLSNKTSKVLS